KNEANEYVIQIGLNSILYDEHKSFKDKINEVVCKCTKILFDSNKFLQLHILRCLYQKNNLPTKIDQTYLNQINRLLTNSKIVRKEISDVELLETYNQYFKNYKKLERNFIFEILNTSNRI